MVQDTHTFPPHRGRVDYNQLNVRNDKSATYVDTSGGWGPLGGKYMVNLIHYIGPKCKNSALHQ